MAKVRAYKIAEELGIDRNEFVAKAKELGVELRSAMVSLEDDDADLLRRKLGKQKPAVERETSRVETKGGAAVIRRRKKKAAPEPEPAPVVEEVEEAAAEEAELATPPSVEEAAAAAEPESIAEEAAAETPGTVSEEARKPAGKRTAVIDTPEPTPEREKKRVRKRVVVEGNLQEQEKLARQVTGRKFGAKTAP
ncbi:MAG: translation initiation factor IF-2 N-terminal domain-containing protein, partial [Deltaproteobacteria bacterium]|nr:translation initiation factor IF-2 N-terminal domain-containing protein [Deltaproteobacteria bacterium]